MLKPIYEFILWDNCNNSCPFCWQKRNGVRSLNSVRFEAAQKAGDFFQAPEYKSGSHAMICGGELFDTEPCYVSGALAPKLFRNMRDNIIDLLYVNTNLLYSDTDQLNRFLALARCYGVLERIKLVTSWDKMWRFKPSGELSEEQWTQNMDMLRQKYGDELNIVVNTILTRDFCEWEVERNVAHTKVMFDRFGAYVNLLPYINIDDTLTPDRDLVFRTLAHQEKYNPGYLKNYIANFDLPQEKRVYRFIDGEFKLSSSESNECGHGINFNRYSEEGSCFICDIKELFNG